MVGREMAVEMGVKLVSRRAHTQYRSKKEIWTWADWRHLALVSWYQQLKVPVKTNIFEYKMRFDRLAGEQDSRLHTPSAMASKTMVKYVDSELDHATAQDPLERVTYPYTSSTVGK